MTPALLEEYLRWLRERWSIELEGTPFEHETYDPSRPLADPETRLGILEERDAALGLASDQATLFVAESLRREAVHLSDRVVWEVGCGTGVLSALAGKL